MGRKINDMTGYTRGRIKVIMSIKEALETPIKGGKGIGYKPKKKEK